MPIQDQASVGTTYQWTLICTNKTVCDSVLLLEECLWTLNGVQSIEEVFRKDSQDILDYQLDGENRLEHLKALSVVSETPETEAEIKSILASQASFTYWEVSEMKSITLEDWAESWKQHWKPTKIHDGLTICPSWLDYQPDSQKERVITLDPGAAFGTGTHETTCLMLEGLDALSNKFDFSKISVLDVGTGSGILAIESALLGCKSVMGVDNDPNSIPAAIENAERNNVGSACHFSATALEDLCHTKHDVVLANIIAPVILALLPEMLIRLTDDGYLMLSGLIEKNLPDVFEALQAVGFTHIEKRQLGDWFALDCRK